MGSEDAQPAQSRMKKNRVHYSHPPSPEDARMRTENPKETLKSLEETRATLKSQLCAVEFYIGHLKTNVINVTHVRSPFAQRPVTRAQSSSNERGSTGTVNTVNTAEASSPSTSDDETVPSETSSEETDTSFVKVKEKSFSSYSFTQKLRPRGSRGKESTATRKAKYEAKKEERNKTLIPLIPIAEFPIPILSVPKRGKNKCASLFSHETENIDPNGKSKNVSDENNVANKGCENNKLFASLFPCKGEKPFSLIGGDIAPEQQALSSLSSLFPPTEHEILSSRGEDETAALDKTRVSSSKEEQDADPHQGTNEFYSIGGEEETAEEETAAPHHNRVNSSNGRHDHLEACGGDVVIPRVQHRIYAPRLSEHDRLSNVKYYWTLEQTLKAAQDKARSYLDEHPMYLTKYKCEDCGVNPKCCFLKRKQQEGPNAIRCISEQALESVLPTVAEVKVADACSKVIVYCDEHGHNMTDHLYLNFETDNSRL